MPIFHQLHSDVVLESPSRSVDRPVSPLDGSSISSVLATRRFQERWSWAMISHKSCIPFIPAEPQACFFSLRTLTSFRRVLGWPAFYSVKVSGVLRGRKASINTRL